MSNENKDWIAAFDKLDTLLSSLEMRKLYNLYFKTELIDWSQEDDSLIVGIDGKKTLGKVKNIVKGWRTSVKIQNDHNVLYYQQVEGIGEEEKYLSLYYCYKDLLNSGLQYMYLVHQEKAKMDIELAEATKNKFKA